MRAKLRSSYFAVSVAREAALAGGATDASSAPNAKPAKGARKAAAAAANPAADPVPVNGAQVGGLEPDDIGYLKALREAQVSAEQFNGVRTEAMAAAAADTAAAADKASAAAAKKQAATKAAEKVEAAAAAKAAKAEAQVNAAAGQASAAAAKKQAAEKVEYEKRQTKKRAEVAEKEAAVAQKAAAYEAAAKVEYEKREVTKREAQEKSAAETTAAELLKSKAALDASRYASAAVPVGGLLRTITRASDVEFPPPPRVWMSIHPEGKSCGHVRSRLECLLSLALLPGPERAGPVRANQAGREAVRRRPGAPQGAHRGRARHAIGTHFEHSFLEFRGIV